MKVSKIIFVVLISLNVCASEVTETNIENNTHRLWSIEGQFNTISNSITTTFGPSIFYSLNQRNLVGFRILAPVVRGEGAMSEFLVYRHNFSIEKTSLFLEASAGFNQYSVNSYVLNSPSVGTNFGITHHLNQDISFGGLGGMEWTHTYATKDYAVDTESNIYAYGRLALFGSINF